MEDMYTGAEIQKAIKFSKSVLQQIWFLPSHISPEYDSQLLTYHSSNSGSQI